jgi:hypothetical protein
MAGLSSPNLCLNASPTVEAKGLMSHTVVPNTEFTNPSAAGAPFVILRVRTEHMAVERSDESAERRIGPIEHELSLHLERAHELAERAQRSNDAVQHEIDRALEIFDRLRDHVADSQER